MQPVSTNGRSPRTKFVVGGLLILVALIYLIYSSTKANAEYFMTVDELQTRSDSLLGRNLRISGAVVGSTIHFEPDTHILTFEIANVPGDNSTITAQGGLAKVLHDAVMDPTNKRLIVNYTGPKPDLMRDEAQAILTGYLAEDGIFQAEELLLKCPTKYEDSVPSQVSAN
jgi:cytochrome c-type biogenesis protein CcmE